MNHLYFALYKNSDYRTIVLTSIAECILNSRGYFSKDKFVLKNSIGLNQYSKQILSKIKLDEVSTFHLSDYHKWIAHLTNQMISSGWLKRHWLIGLRRTKKFSQHIIKIKDQLNQSVVSFINLQDDAKLSEIDGRLRSVNLPIFRNSVVSKKANLDRMMQEVISNGYGIGALPHHRYFGVK